MTVGILKETKSGENRVAATPAYIAELVSPECEVLVQSGSGLGSGYDDHQYAKAGAEIVESAEEVWAEADLIVKVKEPLGLELELMREGQTIFAYFHFAASPELTVAHRDAGVIAIAYETIVDPFGRLPLLEPMSEVAGRLAVQHGAACCESHAGGPGVLLSGVPGVPPANVTILGGGTVGSNAARLAAGLGANVTVLDINLGRLRHLAETMPANVNTLYCNRQNICDQLEIADLVIGAVLVPGGRAPRLVELSDLKRMKPRSVVVDVAIDQGGCFETSRCTSHAEPTYEIENVVHYCVPNMPGCVARTSTQALTNATLPYTRMLATNRGADEALLASAELRSGLNMYRGKITHEEVARCFNLPLEFPEHLVDGHDWTIQPNVGC